MYVLILFAVKLIVILANFIFNIVFPSAIKKKLDTQVVKFIFLVYYVIRYLFIYFLQFLLRNIILKGCYIMRKSLTVVQISLLNHWNSYRLVSSLSSPSSSIVSLQKEKSSNTYSAVYLNDLILCFAYQLNCFILTWTLNKLVHIKWQRQILIFYCM